MPTDREVVIDGYVRRLRGIVEKPERSPKEVWEENEDKRAKDDVPVDKEVA